MPTTEQLARQFTFEVFVDGDWLRITNVNNFTPSPSSQNADTTTFDDEGFESHLKASRGATFTLGGLFQEDKVTGARDPGQVAVEEWARAIGPEATKPFRYITPGGNIFEFDATAEVTPGGGGNNDPAAWSLTLTRSGPPRFTSAANAVPLAAPTSPVGTALNAAATVTFAQAGAGATLYEAQVFQGATLVATVQSTSKPIYIAGLTNGTAYTAKGRTKNAHGWSALSVASATFTPSA